MLEHVNDCADEITVTSRMVTSAKRRSARSIPYGARRRRRRRRYGGGGGGGGGFSGHMESVPAKVKKAASSPRRENIRRVECNRYRIK